MCVMLIGGQDPGCTQLVIYLEVVGVNHYEGGM